MVVLLQSRRSAPGATAAWRRRGRRRVRGIGWGVGEMGVSPMEEAMGMLLQLLLPGLLAPRLVRRGALLPLLVMVGG